MSFNELAEGASLLKVGLLIGKGWMFKGISPVKVKFKGDQQKH